MSLQSPRAHCKALVGPGSIWKYVEAMVRVTTISGKLAHGFQTDLHFADVSRCCTAVYPRVVQCVRASVKQYLLNCVMRHVASNIRLIDE